MALFQSDHLTILHTFFVWVTFMSRIVFFISPGSTLLGKLPIIIMAYRIKVSLFPILILVKILFTIWKPTLSESHHSDPKRLYSKRILNDSLRSVCEMSMYSKMSKTKKNAIILLIRKRRAPVLEEVISLRTVHNRDRPTV